MAAEGTPEALISYTLFPYTCIMILRRTKYLKALSRDDVQKY